MERFFTGAQKNWSITELLSAHEGQIMQKAWHMAFTGNDLFDRDFSLVAFAKTAGKARAQMAYYLEWDMKDAFKQINRVRRAPDFDLVMPGLDPELRTLTERELKILIHAYGLFSDSPGYRNRYVADEADPVLQSLVARKWLNFTTSPAVVNGMYRLTDDAIDCILTLLPQSKIAIASNLFRRAWRQSVIALTDTEISEREIFSLEEIKVNARIADFLHEQQVHIYSGEHSAYWRADGIGYTDDIDMAGVYEFKDALKSSSSCGPEKRIQYRIYCLFEQTNAQEE
jgi:hypothetical protein